jgi:uncharacterized Zn finger protein
MSISKLSEFTIRRHANSTSFQRGEAYYAAGTVLSVTQRGSRIHAEVAGSEAQPYHVSLNVNGDGLISGICTCAYNYEGWCKHIVAAMLACVRQPETVEQRPSLEQLLEVLDYLQTQQLIQELVAQQPQLIEVIDQHVSWMTTPTTTREPAKSHTPIDLAPYHQQVRQILRDAVRYWESGEDDDPISEELLSLVQAARDYSEQGQAHSAIAILETITSTCVENWDDVANYGADNEEIAQELDAAWCEAILCAELTPEEKANLQIQLASWQDEWNADFTMSLEALRQDWDEPSLVQILQGNITPRGIWEGEIPDYADKLALIRLKILERQERYQEYLYLANAEGQTQHYLAMLGRLGRVEEAMTAAQTQMTTMEQAFTLAKILALQGALTQALEIAQTGLNLPGKCQYEMGFWTSTLAEELGDKTATLSAIQAAFQAKPSLVDYLKIQDLAGENWVDIKPELLKILSTFNGWGTEPAKVDIYLHEGLIDQAIAAVDELSSNYYSELIQRVMKAAMPHNPNWVIANACRRAEWYMDRGKAEHYEEAVEWLKQARSAYFASGKQADWVSYRAQLIQVHGRKRKLMGLFQEQGME